MAGKLQHACKMVRPRRTFLRRVFEAMKVTNKKYHHIRLNAGLRSDKNTFLASWNGVAIMPGSTSIESTIEAYTDASGEVGCGAWWSHYWIQLKWTQLKWSPRKQFGDLPIMQKEVHPLHHNLFTPTNTVGHKLGG